MNNKHKERTFGPVTLSLLNHTASIPVDGNSSIGVAVWGALTANMHLWIEYTPDNGATWDERMFFNGDMLVGADVLPHAVEDLRTYSIVVNPADTHMRVRVAQYTSGSVSVVMKSSNVMDSVNTLVQIPVAVQRWDQVMDGVSDTAETTTIYGASTGFYLRAGTFAGTIVCEGSPDTAGEANWNVVAFFGGGQWRNSYALTNPNSNEAIGLLMSAAYARVRMRVSAYTSGSMSVVVQNSQIRDSVTPLVNSGIDTLGVPSFTTMMGGKDGGTLRAIGVMASEPIGTENGTVVRISRGQPVYYFYLPSQVHVAGANTVHWDLFNAHASLVVRVLSILQIPNITTAVTGITFDWLLERTTSVGTGGSALTAWLPDLSQTALDAAITCRSKPTGGAAQSTDLRTYSLSSEETNAATIQIASQGGLELLPEPLRPANGGIGLVLRTNQGLRDVQVTNSLEGNTGWLIGFTAAT